MRLSPLVGFFSTALAWVKESKLNLPWYLFDTETWVPVAEEEEGGWRGTSMSGHSTPPLLYYNWYTRKGLFASLPQTLKPFDVFHC